MVAGRGQASNLRTRAQVDGTENTQRKEERGTRRAASKRQRTSAHLYIIAPVSLATEEAAGRPRSQVTCLPEAWTRGFLIKQMDTAGIVGNLQTSLSNSMLKSVQKVSRKVTKVCRICYKNVSKTGPPAACNGCFPSVRFLYLDV
jgi:hypothetical protein